MNLSQVFFGVGAFLGPLIPVFIISRGANWKYSYIVLSIICLINLIFFLFLKLPETTIEEKSGSISSFNSVISENGPMFFLLIFAIFFYVSTEIGLAFWLPTFLRMDKSFTSVLAGQTLSFFWLSFVVGRTVIGIMSKKIRILKILMVITILSFPTTLVGIYTGNYPIIILAFMLTGLLFSGIWPLLVSLGGLKFSDNRDLVVSVLIMAGGAGGLFAPWFIGKIFNDFDLKIAMNTTFILLFLLLLSIIGLLIIDRRGPKARSSYREDM